MDLPVLTVDIEVTNRCNADCYFCPRDQTPHQGLMSPEVFDRSLLRAIELHDIVTESNTGRVVVSLCGLGEPLINKHLPTFARQVRDAGLGCAVSSNAALLDKRRGQELLDAGVQTVYLNVGERAAAYEEIYKLPWRRTRDNVFQFHEMAAGRCDVYMVLVDHRRDKDHVADMRRFWQKHGLTKFLEFDIMNRGGALFVDHMQYSEKPEIAAARELLEQDGSRPICTVPFFGSHFIGYDGRFYLCCSDWKKEADLGSVFDAPLEEVTRLKFHHVVDRTAVCQSCNLDPINRIAEELQAETAGEVSAGSSAKMATDMRHYATLLSGMLDLTYPGLTDATPADSTSIVRKLIPVMSK